MPVDEEDKAGRRVVSTDGTAWHAARLRAHASVTPLPIESVAVGEAVGRTLAEPLVAARPLPGFDSAAMDGYAVRGPTPWLVEGRTLAGESAGGPLARGRAREVATGAPVPPGTDAVVPYERARRCGELVNGTVDSPNIRRAGEEAAAGQELLLEATVISPSAVGLIAALGYDDVRVVCRPRVAALITGDELIRGGAPRPGQLRDAIGPMLPAFTRHVGASLVSTAYLPDYRDALVDGLKAADVDVLLVTGSSSVGRADYLRSTLEGLDAEPVAVGVACRPGHTQSLWRLADGRIVIGLPGNPLAAVVAFLTLAAPCCAGLLGLELPTLRRVTLGSLRAHPTRTRLAPVRTSPGGIEALDYDGSAMLRGLALADALAVVPPANAPHSRVELLALPGHG